MAWNAPGLPLDTSAKSTPIVGESSPGIGPTSPSLTMCDPFEGLTYETSTSSAEASPVKTSASRVKGRVSPVCAADCGVSTPGSSTTSARRMSSSKMLQPFALGDWIAYSGKSLRSGMTRNGIVYPLPPWVLLTGGIGSGLWPTPHANCHTGAGHAAQGGMNIQTAVQLFPTPTANRRDGLQSHGVNVITGSLNPRWVEWLMGYPDGWTDLGDSATPLSRRSRRSSAAPSSPIVNPFE